MMKKTIVFFFLFSTAAALTSFKPVKPQVLKTIVIDAGHGIMANGNRNGAKGAYSYEDDICLDISKKLVAIVAREYPHIRIVETRPTEKIVDLRERANIANRERGDLFVSIHVNAMPPIQHRKLVGYKTDVYYTGKGKKRRKHTRKIPQYHYYETPHPRKGTETYIWGSHKGDDKELAVRENAPMLAEENYKEKYGEMDPNSPEFIALSLAKTKQFTLRSATLAGFVEDQFAKIGRISGGKKQRQVGIWVLQATAMPSVLVETGFITNPEEERYLNSESGQTEIAQSIANAIGEYIKWLEKRQIPSNGKNGNVQSAVPDNAASVQAFLQSVEADEKKKWSR